MHSKEFSGNQGKHQNFNPSILPYTVGLIFMRMKQFLFIFFFKFKMADSKKLRFSKLPILKILSRKVLRIGSFENLSFFESAISKVFFFSSMKINQHLKFSKDGSNFDDYSGYQPKTTHPKHSWGECTLS